MKNNPFFMKDKKSYTLPEDDKWRFKWWAFHLLMACFFIEAAKDNAGGMPGVVAIILAVMFTFLAIVNFAKK